MSTPPAPLDETARYVLLGWPLRSSLSPAMHDAAFRALGIRARYDLRPVRQDDLRSAVDEVRSGALSGANVTIPHKMAVRAWLDGESAAARRIGAVNTIVRNDNGLWGENTDATGFMRALEAVGLGATSPPASGTDPGRAIVLGAGGAARAVVDVLLGAGWAVTVLSRSVSAGALLLRRLGPHHPQAITAGGALDAAAVAAQSANASLLVNATPVGDSRSPGDCLWPEHEPIPASLAVIDLVAWPPRTRLVDRASASGSRAVGGLPMLIAQAAESFELWTGLPAPLTEMTRAAHEAADFAAQQEGSP